MSAELLGLQVVENLLRVSQLARELAIDYSGVARALALLDLPAPVQERVELAPSVAYEVSKLANPEQQTEFAVLAVAEGLNRAEVVEAVRRSTRPASKGRGSKAMATLEDRGRRSEAA